MTTIKRMVRSNNIKLKWFENKNKNSLSEMYQSIGTLFAFVSSKSDGYRVCHDWVKCRDFLNDALRTQIGGIKSQIYGFIFESDKNPPVDLNITRLAVTMDKLNNQEAIDKFENGMRFAIKLINHFERYAKIPLSKVEKVDPNGSKKGAVCLFTGPKVWISSPFLISMYTFLIRMGFKELEFRGKNSLTNKFDNLIENKNTSDNDTAYLRSVAPFLHRILSEYSSIFDIDENGFHNIYKKNLTIGAFHNNTGIVSLVKATTPDPKLNELIKEKFL